MASNLDWMDGLVDELAKNASSGGGNTQGVYFKMEPGQHRVRVIPAGNDIDKVPYVVNIQHSYNVMTPEGKMSTSFALCYNHIANNLKTLGKLLVDSGQLSKVDMQMFKLHGCPGCAAVNKLQNAGLAKEVWMSSIAKTSYLVNILARADSKVYVWNISKKVFGDIFSPVAEFAKDGMNALHPITGFDVLVNATGAGFQRRYSVAMFPKPVPLAMPEDQRFYNLYEVLAKGFRSYRDFSDLTMLSFGKYFTPAGISMPGATVEQLFNDEDQGQFQSAGLAVNIAQSMMPETVPQSMPLNQLEQEVIEHKVNDNNSAFGDDDLIEKDGHFYTKDGKMLF